MEKTTHTKLRPWRYGVTEAAKITGRSKCHISCVLRGKRVPGAELREFLEKLGFKVPEVKQ